MKDKFIMLSEEGLENVQRYGSRLYEQNIIQSGEYITQFLYQYMGSTYLIIKYNGDVVTAFKVKGII